MQNSMGSKLSIIAILGLFLFSANTTMAGDIYKTEDAYGNVVYTDTPPKEGETAERLSRKTQRTNSEYVSQTKETLAASRQASIDRRTSGNQDSKRAADIAEQRKANCTKSRERLANIQQSRRMYEDIGNGERRYFSAEEQDDYKAKVTADVAEWCD